MRKIEGQSINTGSYIVMLSANASLGIVLAVMPAVLPQLARAIGSVKSAELVATVAAFGMVAGGLVSGRILRRFGIRRVMVNSLAVFAICSLAGMLSANLAVLVLCRFALGIAAVCFSTSSLALTAVTFAGDARSRFIGLQQATSQLVCVLVALGVGVTADTLGWRSSFIMLMLCAMAILIAAQRVGIATSAVSEIEAQMVGTDFWYKLAPVLMTAVLLGAVTVVPMTQVPFLIADVYHRSPIAISIVADLNFGSAAISALMYAGLKRRFAGPATFALGLCIGACGIALSGFATSLWAFSIGSVGAGFGTGIYNSYIFDRGIEVAGESRHADAAGSLFALICFGAAINPFLLAPFESVLGEHGALIGFGLTAVVCGLFLGRLADGAPGARRP